MMKRFESDYLEGAHPDVLRALIETNGEQTPGYGEDPHCEAARALLRERCELPEGEVQFLVGGTQVNRTVIASILRPIRASLRRTPATSPRTRPARSKTPATRC